MDWLRQLPIGQYVDGEGGWLRRLDLLSGWFKRESPRKCAI